MDVQLLTDYERASLSERQALPDAYLRLSQDELDARIAGAKAALGDRVVVLGHHYQRDEVIAFADKTGDSPRLPPASRQQRTWSSVACTLWPRSPTCCRRRTSG